MPTAQPPIPTARIACVICAYNEAPRLPAVLAAVAGHPLLAEVIVVDDGSSDGTAEVAAQFAGTRVIRHAVNRGKSAAIATGVGAARHEYLMLLDADLVGLTADHVTALADPVLAGAADLSLSLRRNSLRVFRRAGLDFVSGERVLKRDFLATLLDEIGTLPRFGIEVFMNRRIIDRRLGIHVTRWDQVTQTRKTDKVGLWRGIRAEWRMVRDLLRVAPPLELLAQSWHMSRLRRPQAASAGLLPDGRPT